MKRNNNTIVMMSALALASLSAACTDAQVTGSFGDRELRVSGTAYGWIDETEYVEDSEGGTPLLKDRATDAVIMHLVFTEAVFDARVDMRALPAGERERIFSDIARGDRLNVDIRRGNVIRAGDDIELVPADGSLPPEVLPFITKVSVALGEPVLDPQAKYPDQVVRIGSEVDAKLEVTETSPELVGSVTIKAEKAEGEEAGFVEGKVTVSFAFELLPERLAECNFAPGGAGVVSACDLQ